MYALGRLFDIGTGVVPVDLNTADGATGKRISMVGCESITVVCFIGAAASGTDDVVIDIQQHTAYTSGTSNDLDATGVTGSTGITEWYIKSETALDNDEGWTKVTQSAASEVTLTGATYAAVQKIVVIEVDAAQLAPTYTHISANIAVTTSAAQLAAVLYFPHELKLQRKPAKLSNLLRPNAANA